MTPFRLGGLLEMLLTYSVPSATQIYQAVITLMQRMAEHGMREKGQPVAVIVALAAP